MGKSGAGAPEIHHAHDFPDVVDSAVPRKRSRASRCLACAARMLRMESDLRTPAARLRAGLANLSATLPDPKARPLPRTAASRLRPLGSLLGGQAGGDPAGPEPGPPRPGRPRAAGGPGAPTAAAPCCAAGSSRSPVGRLLAGAVRQAAATGLGRPAPAPGRQA